MSAPKTSEYWTSQIQEGAEDILLKKTIEELEQHKARIEQVEALMVLYRNEGKLRDALVVHEVLGILRGAKS